MKKAVAKVIRGIQVGTHFDVHFVANKLFLQHTNEYYRLVRENPNINQAMLVRKIGQTIVEHFPDCEPVGKSISYNIHGNETAVRLFKRIKYPVRYVDG